MVRVRTLIAVPMRDSVGRPAGMLLALDARRHELDVEMMDGLRRLGGTVAGRAGEHRRAPTHARRRSLRCRTWPTCALERRRRHHAAGGPGRDRGCARPRATRPWCGCATRPARTWRHWRCTAACDDAVADIVGTRTVLEGEVQASEVGGGEFELVELTGAPRGWSSGRARIAHVLGARSIAAIRSRQRFERDAVLYVARKTSRAFDEPDRACIRIVTGHAQHVIDRHVAETQTERAIGAARNAHPHARRGAGRGRAH